MKRDDLQVGQKVTWTRGGGYPEVKGCTVQSVGWNWVRISWRWWDGKNLRWKEQSRHARHDQLTLEEG